MISSLVIIIGLGFCVLSAGLAFHLITQIDATHRKDEMEAAWEPTKWRLVQIALQSTLGLMILIIGLVLHYVFSI